MLLGLSTENYSVSFKEIMGSTKILQYFKTLNLQNEKNGLSVIEVSASVYHELKLSAVSLSP